MREPRNGAPHADGRPAIGVDGRALAWLLGAVVRWAPPAKPGEPVASSGPYRGMTWAEAVHEYVRRTERRRSEAFDDYMARLTEEGEALKAVIADLEAQSPFAPAAAPPTAVGVSRAALVSKLCELAGRWRRAYIEGDEAEKSAALAELSVNLRRAEARGWGRAEMAADVMARCGLSEFTMRRIFPGIAPAPAAAAAAAPTRAPSAAIPAAAAPVRAPVPTVSVLPRPAEPYRGGPSEYEKAVARLEEKTALVWPMVSRALGPGAPAPRPTPTGTGARAVIPITAAAGGAPAGVVGPGGRARGPSVPQFPVLPSGFFGAGFPFLGT